MGVFIGASTKIVDRATRRDPSAAACRPIRWSCRAPCPGAPLPDGPARAGPRLRGDRQAGRRQDPRQDLDQRAAACMIALTDPVALAQALIRCPSVTPEDAGALDVVEDALARLGFTLSPADLRGRRARRRSTTSTPASARAPPTSRFAGHTDVVPPGDLAGWRVDPFAGEVIDGVLYGRGAVDMKGAIACFVAAAARFLERASAGGLDQLPDHRRRGRPGDQRHAQAARLARRSAARCSTPAWSASRPTRSSSAT